MPEIKSNNLRKAYYIKTTEPVITATSQYFTGKNFNRDKVVSLIKHIYTGESGDFLLHVDAKDNKYEVSLAKLYSNACDSEDVDDQHESKSFEFTAKWEIEYDGYYPYCSACKYEPNYSELADAGLPKICPHCQRCMTNASELNDKHWRKTIDKREQIW